MTGVPGSVWWHREEDGEEGYRNVGRGGPVEIVEADLVSLCGLPEAQVEVLPEEFHWHVDETPLEAASGCTVPEEDTEEHRRHAFLSVSLCLCARTYGVDDTPVKMKHAM